MTKYCVMVYLNNKWFYIKKTMLLSESRKGAASYKKENSAQKLAQSMKDRGYDVMVSEI